jgi:16S rRNA (adenine1518-N6/adenine1519-N6)-dimethyltransferase
MDKIDYLNLYRRVSANKSLGQNFLTNEAVVKNMVKQAKLTSADTVLEIGPGLGILSQELVASPADTIILCEKDDRFVDFLKSEITSKRVKIIAQDALVLIPQLQVKAPFKVVANLPYNISSPVITSLLTMSPTLPDKIIVMLQKEVAERFVTEPGNRNRGILTVLVEAFGEAKIIDQVPREDFYPSPNVDSAVLQIDEIKLPRLDPKKLLKILKLSFAGKRKKIKNSLFSSLRIPAPDSIKIAQNSGFNLDDRPEDLTIEHWTKLYSELEKFI